MSYDLRLFTVPDHTEIATAYERLVRREESESSHVDEVKRPLPTSIRAQMQQLADSLKARWPAFAQFEPKSPVPWIELNDSGLQIQVSVRQDSVSITMPYFRKHAREMIECVNSCIEVCHKHCGYRAFDPQLGLAVTANDVERIARAYHQIHQALPGMRGESHGRKPWWKFWPR